MPKLYVVIPCYNEANTVEELLRRVETVKLEAIHPGISRHIILVDDGSTDGTRELVQKLAYERKDREVILMPSNQGKGAALRAGFAAIKGQQGDVVIVQDADLEYDPEDYPEVTGPIYRGEAQVVYGSRILHPANEHHSALRFYFGGRFVTLLTNLLYASRLTDEPTCYKAFEYSLLKQIPLVCERFEFCPEITAKLLRKKVEILEVPIRYFPRRPEEGKKIGWFDGIEAIWTLLRWRFARI